MYQLTIIICGICNYNVDPSKKIYWYDPVSYYSVRFNYSGCTGGEYHAG